MRRYLISWKEISDHEVQLDENEFAELVGVGVDEIDDQSLDAWVNMVGLPDALASLDDDGFQGLTRDDIEIIAVRGDES